jgi:hypothetical protein
MRNVERTGASNTDYILRKRKAGRMNHTHTIENTAVEKFNLRVKNRIERDRKHEAKNRELDPYDEIDDYSPERLKTIRNTRALTKKLGRHG